jgi:hypothetical protein
MAARGPRSGGSFPHRNGKTSPSPARRDGGEVYFIITGRNILGAAPGTQVGDGPGVFVCRRVGVAVSVRVAVVVRVGVCVRVGVRVAVTVAVRVGVAVGVAVAAAR